MPLETLFPAALSASASDRSPVARNVLARALGDFSPMPVPNAMRDRLQASHAELVRHRTSSREWNACRLEFAKIAREVVLHVFGLDLTVAECHTRVAFDHGFRGVYRPIIEEATA